MAGQVNTEQGGWEDSRTLRTSHHPSRVCPCGLVRREAREVQDIKQESLDQIPLTLIKAGLPTIRPASTLPDSSPC